MIMGFRCPHCGKDFGFNKQALIEHFELDSGECLAYAGLIVSDIKRMCGKNTKADKAMKAVNHKQKFYSQISPHHNWVKQNLVCDENGYDIVVCSKCGIRAKRFFNSYEFDMRQSMKMIENCKQLKDK